MELHLQHTNKQNDEFEKYCEFIRSNTIGELSPIKTPFGVRSMLYFDWTASGRSLRFIEESLISDVAPYYGNTHSIASNNARQSTWFVYEAREAVRQFVGGNPDDAIIFSGFGSSGAVSKFLRIMDTSFWISVIRRFEQRRELFSKSMDISVNVNQDRWKSFKCLPCDNQYNTEAAFRRHYNKIHRKTNCEESTSSKHLDTEYRIRILLDPSSHHSLLLPFIEYAKKNSEGVESESQGFKYKLTFDLEYLQLNQKGEVDLIYLNNIMTDSIKYDPAASQNPKCYIPLALISAGSNITGRINDYTGISQIIHEYGGICVVDFAAVAPHSRPSMSPPLNPQGHIDVGVFSPHKLIGGPSTPGVLVMKRDLLLTEKPSDPGGNSVFFVSLEEHEYILNKEEREESGTTDILGISRLGMVMKLEMKIPYALKMSKERLFFERIISEWQIFNEKNAQTGQKIHILGIEELILEGKEPGEQNYISSLPIVSFLIRPFIPDKEGKLLLSFISQPAQRKVVRVCGENYAMENKSLYLHYNFVCSLLNDLFGIQTRGGCSCAGPHSQRLLGYDQEKARELYRDLVIKGIESIRPGFSRISLHWSHDVKSIDYVIKAVCWVAENGWKFLPLYIFEESLGTWRHRSEWKSLEKIHRRWLSDSVGKFCLDKFLNTSEEGASHSPLKEYVKCYDNNFEIANRILLNLEEIILNSSCRQNESEADISLQNIIYSNNQHFSQSINSADLSNLNDFELLSESSLQWFITPKYVQNLINSIRTSSGVLDNSNLTNMLSMDAVESSSGPTTKESNPSKRQKNLEGAQELIQTNSQDCKRNRIAGRFGLFPKPADFGIIRKQVGQAIKKFGMIKEGDKVLVAVSGGKDSLSMLHILLFLQRIAPVKFQISAATVDPQTSEMDASKLIPYMDSIGVKYHFISYPIVDIASQVKQKQKKLSFCSFCSRMKRGLLYSCMRENGYNVLSLGQHADDICESFLLSIMNNGKLNTMKANYFVPEYNVRVIRPMIYCRERDLANFATKLKLPIIAENCPACFSQPKERRHVKQLLSQEESHNPTIYSSIMNALHPLISINHTNSATQINANLEEENVSLITKLDEDISSELLLTSCSR
ncbi:PP-loop family protein [Cryptosporidium felis]|nr:PP-loop family protein [Cryptosporidium felis]